jgi:NAD(P)-dependent dehydrogenase (short-subunit alcohol dehydrogenase family)
MTSPTQTIALITGVGRPEGIGFELGRQFLARGFTVLVAARRQSCRRVVAQASAVKSIAEANSRREIFQT